MNAYGIAHERAGEAVRRPPRPPGAQLRARQGSTRVKLLNGGAVPSHGLLPPGMFGRDEALAPYPHDPAKARALLAEAGYPTASTSTTSRSTTRRPRRSRRRYQADFAEVGVRVHITILSFAAYVTAIGRPDGPPFSLGGWVGDFPDPTNFFDVAVPLADDRRRELEQRLVLREPRARRAARPRPRRDRPRRARGDVPPRRAHPLRRRALGVGLPPRDDRGHAAVRARLRAASGVGAATTRRRGSTTRCRDERDARSCAGSRGPRSSCGSWSPRRSR